MVVLVRMSSSLLPNTHRTGLLYFSETIRPTRSTEEARSLTLAMSLMGQSVGTTRRQSRNSPSSRRQTRVALPTWKRMCLGPKVKEAMSSTSETIFSTSFSPGEGTTKLISRPVPSSG